MVEHPSGWCLNRAWAVPKKISGCEVSPGGRALMIVVLEMVAVFVALLGGCLMGFIFAEFVFRAILRLILRLMQGWDRWSGRPV